MADRPASTRWSTALTTFVATFMIGHAYSFWMRSYTRAREIQGRLADIGLLLSTHAARESGRAASFFVSEPTRLGSKPPRSTIPAGDATAAAIDSHCEILD